MQRSNIARHYLTRICSTLRNLHDPSTYYICSSRGNRNPMTALTSSRPRRYPMKLTFAVANILTYMGFVKKTEMQEFHDTVEKGEQALMEKNLKLAEQLFHEALNIAQNRMKNENEVTNIYYKLVDIAFEMGNYKSAKKLLTSLMQRLFSIGVEQYDLRILKLSLKLAKTFEHLKKYSDAELGYRYCIRGIQTHLVAENPFLDHAQDFLLLLLTDYAYFQYERGLLNKALEYFQQAYEVCVRTRGDDDRQTILLLNNLGTINRTKGDNENALRYFQKAAKLGEKFPNLKDVAYVHLNLGYLHLEKHMLIEARRYCKLALKESKRVGDADAKNESRECLAEVRKAVFSKLLSHVW